MKLVFKGDAPCVASVLFVCCNQKNFVVDALDSILKQEGIVLEILVSDDSSTDGTFSIVERMSYTYRGPHTIVLNRNEQRLGLGHIAFLAEKASCDFQVQAHGDDVAYPNRCLRLWQTHIEQGASVVGSASDKIDAHGRPLTQTPDVPFHDLSVETLVKEGKHKGMFGAVLACHRSVMTQFPRLDGDYLPYGQGVLMCFRAALIDKAYYLDEPLLKYRRHPMQWSRERGPLLPGEWSQEIQLAQQASLLLAIQSDLKYWVKDEPERADRHQALQQLIETHLAQSCSEWILERRRVYQKGFRPNWVPLEDFRRRYMRLPSLVSNPLIRETFYWIDRGGRYMARRLGRSY